MNRAKLLNSLALAALLSGATLMGAGAELATPAIPAAAGIILGCALITWGVCNPGINGLGMILVGAAVLGGFVMLLAQAAMPGAAVPSWLWFVGVLLTMFGLGWRILRPAD